jgi:uncharacterized protein (TIGR00156 family)
MATRLVLWKGVLRRFALRLLDPGYVKSSAAQREGQCARCGACCRLLVPRCVYLSCQGEGGKARCTKHGGLFMPGNCKVFPIDEQDIRDRNLVSGVPCGYRFGGKNDVCVWRMKMKTKPSVVAGIAAVLLMLSAGELAADHHRHHHYRDAWWTYGPGRGISGEVPGFPVSTIAQAKTMPDDTLVAMEGKIIRHLGKKFFEFSDGTQSVTVEMKDYRWYAAFRPEDTLIIYGEIDRHKFHFIIEVDYVTVKK